MKQRRVPPKTRHRERPDARRVAEPAQQDDPRGYSAPSHTAGQFDDHGWGSGHGTFGFTHSTID